MPVYGHPHRKQNQFDGVDASNILASAYAATLDETEWLVLRPYGGGNAVAGSFK